MQTNIEIDDKLMEVAMEAGGFKTKREAVEAGLRLVARRKLYDGLRALRGKLHWDDSDESWATLRTQPALVVNEASPAPYAVKTTKVVSARRGRTK
jgi:Arc/MetJ family transcription regulator